LPAVPVAAKAAPTPAPFAALAPPPDPTAATVIAQQAQDADKAEQEAAGSAQAPDAGAATIAPVAAPPPPAAEPVSITKGMTTAQATAALGQPKTIIDAGAGKKIYVFKDVKLTFGADGKMTTAE
jgi:hypothetical protein